MAASAFATKATSNEGGNFELPPGGSYPAVLIGLVDLGTHTDTFNNEAKDSRKIMFVWELTSEHQENGETFVVGQAYTWSLNKKAKLRPMIEGWTGKVLSDSEEFDPLTLMGRTCVVNLTEGETGAGKKFVNVTSVTPPMKGLTVPPSTREQFVFHLSMINSALDPLPIPEWCPRVYGTEVVAKIKASHEFQKLPNF